MFLRLWEVEDVFGCDGVPDLSVHAAYVLDLDAFDTLLFGEFACVEEEVEGVTDVAVDGWSAGDVGDVLDDFAVDGAA